MQRDGFGDRFRVTQDAETTTKKESIKPFTFRVHRVLITADGEDPCRCSVDRSPLDNDLLKGFQDCGQVKQQCGSHAVLHVAEGESVSLVCRIDTEPRHRVMWQLADDDRRYQVNASAYEAILTIQNVTHENFQNVTCHDGNDTVGTVELRVYGRPQIIIEEEESEHCHFRYLIYGYPDVTYTYSLDQPGPTVLDGEHVESVSIQDRREKGQVNLIRGCLYVPFNAEIKLSATNEFGHDEQLKEVQAMPANAPDIPYWKMRHADVDEEATEEEEDDVGALDEEDSGESKEGSLPDTSTMAALISIGGVVLLSALIIPMIFWRRWKRAQFLNRRSESGHSGGLLQSSQESAPLSRISHYSMVNNSNYEASCIKALKDIRLIDPSHVEIIDEIGEGAFGVVFRGKLSEDGNLLDVAVKKLKALLDTIPEAIGEVKVLTSLHHPNIVTFHGICLLDTSISMVFEYIPNGDLKSFLRKCDEEKAPLSLADKLCVAHQICLALLYLKSRSIVHRDIACRNCLVGENLLIKIADFGLTKHLYSQGYYRMNRSTMLPVRWMPPESIFYGKFSFQSDMWSFGVTLWEIMEDGKQPYYGLSSQEVIDVIKQGTRLEKPNIPEEIYQLMMACWHQDPHKRIQIETASKHIDEHLNSVLTQAVPLEK